MLFVCVQFHIRVEMSTVNICLFVKGCLTSYHLNISWYMHALVPPLENQN